MQICVERQAPLKKLLSCLYQKQKFNYGLRVKMFVYVFTISKVFQIKGITYPLTCEVNGSDLMYCLCVQKEPV